VVIEVTAENRDRIREYYFSLCDQGKANFLYDHAIGGGTIGLAPSQYPKTAPMHRECRCGSNPELRMHDNGAWTVVCANCGCRSVKAISPMWALRAWDREMLETDKENMTIWEIM
jgi:hypothetical protein